MSGCADGRHPTVRILRGRWRCAVCEKPAEVRFDDEPGPKTPVLHITQGPPAEPEIRFVPVVDPRMRR